MMIAQKSPGASRKFDSHNNKVENDLITAEENKITISWGHSKRFGVSCPVFG